jgi:NAD(P)-dependent dehydrogenase (short-subunit alcohol dehydrogenase family)
MQVAGQEFSRPARRLEGKVAIVTGAGSSGPGFGTGKAIATLFAREGARVVLADAIEDRALETLTVIEAEGGEAVVAAGDITREDDCRRIVGAAGPWERLDILVNNVGLATTGTILERTPQEWQTTIDINLFAAVTLTRLSAPLMQRAGGGAIVNITSMSPWRPYRATAYSVSKGALETLTKATAVDLGPLGIRVNAIAPGPLNTPRATDRQTDEQRRLRRAASLVDREGSGWDVAWAAVYLASDEARYVTGAILPVDGGVSIRGHQYR